MKIFIKLPKDSCLHLAKFINKIFACSANCDNICFDLQLSSPEELENKMRNLRRCIETVLEELEDCGMVGDIADPKVFKKRFEQFIIQETFPKDGASSSCGGNETIRMNEDDDSALVETIDDGLTLEWPGMLYK